jgi:hypothetical protein
MTSVCADSLLFYKEILLYRVWQRLDIESRSGVRLEIDLYLCFVPEEEFHNECI